MSAQRISFAFSCTADGTNYDSAIIIEQYGAEKVVRLAPRHKSVGANPLYEIAMDAHDLESFGSMCISFARSLNE